jgi:hypothetical protein
MLVVNGCEVFVLRFPIDERLTSSKHFFCQRRRKFNVAYLCPIQEKLSAELDQKASATWWPSEPNRECHRIEMQMATRFDSFGSRPSSRFRGPSPLQVLWPLRGSNAPPCSNVEVGCGVRLIEKARLFFSLRFGNSFLICLCPFGFEKGLKFVGRQRLQPSPIFFNFPLMPRESF